MRLPNECGNAAGMHVKNLFAYKRELEKKGLLIKTSTELATAFYEFVRQQNLQYLNTGDDLMRSETTIVKEFQRCNSNATMCDLHTIIQGFVELKKMKRYLKPNIYNTRQPFYSLLCLETPIN